MGDTFHDPVDHMRTTRPFAGESMIDVATWPGYVLIVAGVIALVGCLAAFGTGHDGPGVTTAVVALATTVLGLVWLGVEHWRIRKVADRWYAAHPDVHHQLPSS